LYSGDVIISALSKKPYIENSPAVISMVKALPWTEAVSYRFVSSGVIEANYKNKTDLSELSEEAGGLVAGIDPEVEDAVTGLAGKIIEGKYLDSDDTEFILVGADKFFKYTPIDTPSMQNLKNTGVGDKVRVSVAGRTKEFTIKGIVRSKVGEVDNRIFMISSSLRDMAGRSDNSVNEIILKLKDGADPAVAQSALLAAGAGKWGKVQTWEESQPKFLKDIKGTFTILGDIVGSIGLVVASITIFIVIFINAITRRKFIGIMKGIGINSFAIEFSYVLQSLFYAGIGTAVGLSILFFALVPYFVSHPVNFPFSDGVLAVTWKGALIRAAFLMTASLIAGYIPAKLVIRQNTLDAILGR